MVGDETSDGLAVVLLELYGRERVARRLWPRLVRIARSGEIGRARTLLEAARALRSEQLAAERGQRLLVALADAIWSPGALSAAERTELAEVVGVYDNELWRYYHEGDLVAVRELLGGSRLLPDIGPVIDSTDTIEVLPTPTLDVNEPGAGARSSEAATTSFAWWSHLAVLSAWGAAHDGERPDPGGTREGERALGVWFSIQMDWLEAGRLSPSRRDGLLRVLDSMEW